MGTTAYDCGKIIMNKLGIEGDVLEFMKNFDLHLNTLLPESKLMPGAEKLINFFYNLKIPLALATGSNESNLNSKISKHLELFSKINIKTCGNEVKNGKPNPEIFLKTLEKLGNINPKNVLVFEDSPSGIKAAIDAGCATIMIPDKLLPYEELLNKFNVKPLILLNSLNDFESNLFNYDI